MMSMFYILTLSITLFSKALSTTITLDENNYIGNVSSSSSLNPSPLLLPPSPQASYAPPKVTALRPRMAALVGILTTVFSITFMLLLYAMHCKTGGTNYNINDNVISSSTARKNSGINPVVIDSLPVFRFGSLKGQKEGLECAVCLNKFEPSEVLRLLPKCKHAFHVECVDTWLDAHSTCPLCRHRVNAEDILLVDRGFGCGLSSVITTSDSTSERYRNDISSVMSEDGNGMQRVSGEKGDDSSASSSLEVIVEKPGDRFPNSTTPFLERRSLDSWRSFNKKATTSFISRRSLDSWRGINRNSFDRPRKDGLLLTEDKTRRSNAGGGGMEQHRRVEHRIIISGMEEEKGCGTQQRWSDVQPSDLLYLRSEMILSESRRFVGSRGSRPSVCRQGNSNSNDCNNGGVAATVCNDNGRSKTEGDDK